MSCARCDQLLDELAKARKEVESRTWERDHAIAGYRRVTADLRDLQLKTSAPAVTHD